MKIKIKNSESEVTYSDFTQECNDCINSCSSLSLKVSCPIDKIKKRIGYIDDTNGSLFCCSQSNDNIKSSKTFQNILKTTLKGIEEVEKKKLLLKLETNKLIHNLTKTNAHNIQELYALVPQDTLTQNLDNQLNTISNIISKDIESAARMFLRIAKNNSVVKTEFAAFNKVFGGKSSIKKRKHNIRKVTLNLYHIFFQGLKDNNISVYFEENNDFIFIDYESIHSVLYHLIDNASKYTLANSKMNVRFQNNIDYYSIILEMVSTRILDSEKDKIYQDGFSGKYAKDIKRDGHGIGLGMVHKILEVNDANLVIHRNIKDWLSKEVNGIWYDCNSFEIRIRNFSER